MVLMSFGSIAIGLTPLPGNSDGAHTNQARPLGPPPLLRPQREMRRSFPRYRKARVKRLILPKDQAHCLRKLPRVAYGDPRRVCVCVLANQAGYLRLRRLRAIRFNEDGASRAGGQLCSRGGWPAIESSSKARSLYGAFGRHGLPKTNAERSEPLRRSRAYESMTANGRKGRDPSPEYDELNPSRASTQQDSGFERRLGG
jgi:hypothetical protein